MRQTILSFVLSFCILLITTSFSSKLCAQENAIYSTHSSTVWKSNSVITNDILINQFNDLFPSGKLEVGCGSSKLVFANGESLRKYLVYTEYKIAGQTPTHLKKYLVKNSELEILAKEVLSLKLNIALNDKINGVNPMFKYLMYLSPNFPSFYGSRVNSVLLHSENALGACTNSHIKPTEFIDALKEINAGFVNRESSGVLFPARDN